MSSQDTDIYRRDAAASGSLLGVEEREALLRKYLPEREDDEGEREGGEVKEEEQKTVGDRGVRRRGASVRTSTTLSSTSNRPSSSGTTSRKAVRRKPIRRFLKNQLYLFVYALMQLFFGIYIRLRRVWRGIKALVVRVAFHHHRTPELIENDVAGLSRLPKHLSVLLELPVSQEDGEEEENVEGTGGRAGGLRRSGSRAAAAAARRAMRKRMASRRKKRRVGRREKVDEGKEEEEDDDGITGQGLPIELEALLDDVAELAAWSSAAGIPVLSVYERRGVLKEMIPAVHAAVRARLTSYFGRRQAPTLQVRAPHVPSYLNGDDDEEYFENQEDELPRSRSRSRSHRRRHLSTKHSELNVPTGRDNSLRNQNNTSSPSSTDVEPYPSSDQDQDQDRDAQHARKHLDLLLLSSDDGRATIVDLTKTLAEMSQKQRLSPRDVGVELLEQELNESYGASDPDLLIVFGDSLRLDGYPPWQLRLTEIYCPGDGYARTVDYPVWLRALFGFAKAEMRFGR